MPGEFEQYAVYWVPKRSDELVRFGASWTGWCAERGARRPRIALNGISINIPTVTRQLWRHGFHAVIRAPFRPDPKCGRFSVEHVLGRLSEDIAAIELPYLQLAVVQGCVVLAPFEGCPALDDLVTRVGSEMASLEAPPPADGVTPMKKPVPCCSKPATTGTVVRFPMARAQRFQFPLTDRIDLKIAQEVIEALRPMLEPMLDKPRLLHDVALMGDPGGGRPLRVLELYELSNLQRQCKSGALPVQGPDILVPMPAVRTSNSGTVI